MSRHAPRLECSQEVLDKLTALSKSRAEEARKVERARIILACLQGKENQQVAREVGTSIPTVSKWRRRFATGYWRCWNNLRRRAWPTGTDGPWRRGWEPVCTPFSVPCGARGSICNDCALGG